MTIHQVWQRINIMVWGFLMGQNIHLPDKFALSMLLMLAWVTSTFVEAWLDKKERRF